MKENLRDAKTASPNAAPALETCDLILSAIPDCLPGNHAQFNTLTAKAHNRRGDALLLLDRADDALNAFNTAVALTPDDPYIFYNRGRTFLALDRKDEARADFKTASGTKFKKSGAQKLARKALAGMK